MFLRDDDLLICWMLKKMQRKVTNIYYTFVNKKARKMKNVMRKVILFSAVSALLAGCRQEELTPLLVLEETQYSIPAEGGTFRVSYRIENASTLPSAASEDSWLTEVTVVDNTIFEFTAEANTLPDSREGSIVLSCPGAEDVELTVVQASSEYEEDTDVALRLEVSNVTSFTADVKVTPASDTLTFVMLTRPRAEVDAFDDDDLLVQSDIAVFQETADYYGVSLEYFLSNSGVLYSGEISGTMTTFSPEQEYYVYTYGLNTDAELTTEVFKEQVTTPAVQQYDAEIEFLSNEIDTRSMDVTVRPGSTDFRYLAGYFTEDEFNSIDDFIPFMIEETELVIYMNNALGIEMTWEDVTYNGDTRLQASGLYSGSNYVWYAFGVEQGYSNTSLFNTVVRTADVEIVDDCSFEVSIQEADTYSVSFTVSPSSSSTRYLAMVSETASLEGLSDEYIADACINSLDSENMDWTSDPIIRQGMLSEEYDGLAPVTDYSIIVFGVNESGERTTEVVIENFRTSEVPMSDMSLEINVTDMSYSSVTVDIRPSIEGEDYVYGIMTSEQYMALGGDPETVRDSIALNGADYSVASADGDVQTNLYLDIEYGFIVPGQDYVVFAFGCSYWYPTTDLYVCEITTPEREVSDAFVETVLTVFNGDDLVAYDPDKYPSETYSGQAAVYIRLIPNSDVSSYYQWIELRSADYMNGLNYDVLLAAIKSNGTYYGDASPRAFIGAVPWEYQNYCMITLGVDASGADGAPLITSLCLSEDQAVPFDPDIVTAGAGLSESRVSSIAGGMERAVVRDQRQTAVRGNVPGRYMVTETGLEKALAARTQSDEAGTQANVSEEAIRKAVERTLRPLVEAAGGEYPDGNSRSLAAMLKISGGLLKITN